MTVHGISSALNKQVLHETLAIFWTGLLFMFIYFATSRNDPVLLKLQQSAASPHRFPKTRRRSEMPYVLLCFFTLLSGKNMSCNFPGGFLGQCLSVKRHHGAALDSFLSISFFFFFFFSIVTTLLCCFTDFPAAPLPRCLKSNAENL